MYSDFERHTNDEWYRDDSEDICPLVYMIPYMPPFTEYDDYRAAEEEDMMRQPPYSVARLLSLYESKSPRSFTQLERYRIPRFFIRRLFRAVIGYVLRNVNIAVPLPQPVSLYAENLLNKLVGARPMFQNVFTFFGVPVALSRSILIDLIAFVLNNAASIK